MNIHLGSAQSNDSNDTVEAPFPGGAYLNIEARLTASSALRSVPVGKPDEADDKITVADIDRLQGINHGRVCVCLNCLAYPTFLDYGEIGDRFPALQQVSCRIEGCTWDQEIGGQHDIGMAIRGMTCHEEIHFR